jgi:hypothetical protein
MTLHVLENRGLALLADLDVQDTRIERLVVELLDYTVMVKDQCARRTPGAIDDCRNFSLVTQAAARTFPLVFTDIRNQIEIVFNTRRSRPTCARARILTHSITN